ncbi:hypothetical protein EJ110_NYTH07157 [Nymphaea thermarum]|nr:hypothetical protein EJ110_NYTH07157 [Nymphaea thermarum]
MGEDWASVTIHPPPSTLPANIKTRSPFAPLPNSPFLTGKQAGEAMASRRPRVLAFLLLLFVFSVRALADAGTEDEVEVEEVAEIASPFNCNPSPEVEKELESLRLKIAAIESDVGERARELKIKNDKILELEKVIQEKSDKFASLQDEIDSLQRKGATDAEEQVGKAHARATELENQITILKSKIDLQNRQQQAAELRASDAEKRTKELSAKVGNLQKASEEQKNEIRRLEKALKLSEEKILKAQRHAESKAKELSESVAAKQWNAHGKPAWDIATQKALEATAKVQDWSKPYIEEINSKWVPVLQEKWVTLCTTVKPHVQTVTTKTVEVYEQSKTVITPHIVKTKEMADPYLKEAKKFAKPYVDQVATVAKPHVDKARLALKPHTEKAVHLYGEFLKSATTYHHQVQSSVRRTLKQHELTRTLATNELVWFMASALLALPILLAYSKKAEATAQSGNSSHAHRRPKRRHTDK